MQDQIQQIVNAWSESAQKACEEMISFYQEDGEEAEFTRKFWKDRLYQSDSLRDGKKAHLIGDNYEKAPFLIFYPEQGKWHYMMPYGEEDPISFEQALTIAKEMWQC